MELDFEEILVDSLNTANTCLNNVVDYTARVNFNKVIEAKTIITQVLQLIYLKNSKLNKDKAPDNNVIGGVLHGIDPNIK